MINIKDIRNFIVKELVNHIGKPVIPSNNIGKKPPYPYILYKFTTPYNSQNNSIEIDETIPSLGTKFKYDIKTTRIEQPSITISFTAVSKDEMESIDLAMQLKDWFRLKGYYLLKRNNLIVKSIEAFGNRDSLIVGDYERKVGFDVILRTVDETSIIVETIEQLGE
ncbi:phage neck terminator protein [Dethiothermospora halolimnae]|uniref:phage neck terminator protein n=1 Tax=Dethiothermospora halolimnae TaxID=3114390 RepID=UPI003CCC0F09